LPSSLFKENSERQSLNDEKHSAFEPALPIFADIAAGAKHIEYRDRTRY
jgi:hypothetical protein